jgi:hypothetical protein
VIAQTQKDQAQQIHCNGTVTEGPGEKIAKLQPNEIDLTESWSKARIHMLDLFNKHESAFCNLMLHKIFSETGSKYFPPSKD